jgi:hypothetical protein
MLTQIDILQAVRDILINHYEYPVYLDEVKEGFESPCFFLKSIRLTNLDNKSYELNNITIYLTFFSEKGTLNAEELYTIQDSLTSYFRSGFIVQKDNRYLLTKNLSHEIDGEDSDIITFSFDIQYYDYLYTKNKEDEAYEKLNTLHLNERLK